MFLRYVRLLSLALALIVPVTAAQGAPDDKAMRHLIEATVTHHIVPRYGRLAEAAAALDGAVAGYCADRGAAGLERVRRAYADASTAWQGIQHVRFGPAELFMRATRLHFWPDPRNVAGRQLDDLLAARDASALTPESFMRASVAVQGFPALERLLFDEDAVAALTSGDDAVFRCDLLRAIAANVASMGAELERDWVGGKGAWSRILVRADGSYGSRYNAPKDVVTDLLKALHLAVELVADHKLARPLGASVAAARPRLAEAWRSHRSLENIRANLTAAAALYEGEGGWGMSGFVREAAGDAALDDLLRRAFAQTRASAAAIKMPLEEAVADPAVRPAVEQLRREAAALKALIVQRLAPALGTPVGFNALDGD
ncbi:MAG: imelysin family protein [Alphaproteobacteria bacterium]